MALVCPNCQRPAPACAYVSEQHTCVHCSCVSTVQHSGVATTLGLLALFPLMLPANLIPVAVFVAVILIWDFAIGAEMIRRHHNLP